MADPLKIKFARQLEEHLPRLRRYAQALTRGRAEADDLVQNCLTRAFAKQALWEPGTDLRAWLFTIMHHLHVNEIRRAIREKSYAEIGSPLPATTEPDADARLELRDLCRAMARLPQKQNRVVMLIGVDGLDYGATAALLGVPVGTVRSRLGRARETLRRELGRPASALPRPSPSPQAVWPAE
jgi:RNA polymerase sigma-70 factor (ECF subfamily)